MRFQEPSDGLPGPGDDPCDGWSIGLDDFETLAIDGDSLGPQELSRRAGSR